MIFPQSVYVYFLCGLVCTCIHESNVELICLCFLRRFNVLRYASGFYMLLLLRQMFMMHVCVCVCVLLLLLLLLLFFGGVVCFCFLFVCGFLLVFFCCCCCFVIFHWHCSAQLSMFNMEKRYRNKIIIINGDLLRH